MVTVLRVHVAACAGLFGAGKLHVQGVPEECRSLLERLGGVRGIATKLSTNVDTGINANDTIERVEAYVGAVTVLSKAFCFSPLTPR
jgi:hypothetical protein